MTERDLALVAQALQRDGAVQLATVANTDEVVGFIALTEVEDHYTQRRNLHVSDLAVAPEHEGRGIASALLRRAEELARARGDHWLSIAVFPQNTRALALYSRLGFQPDIARLVRPLRDDPAQTAGK